MFVVLEYKEFNFFSKAEAFNFYILPPKNVLPL